MRQRMLKSSTRILQNQVEIFLWGISKEPGPVNNFILDS